MRIALSVSFVCRGHPNVTATHDKTLEFTRDAEISRRATCVLGVASDHDDRALLALRGRVEVDARVRRRARRVHGDDQPVLPR